MRFDNTRQWVLLLATLVFALPTGLNAAEEKPAATAQAQPEWLSDYAAAWTKASQSGRMLFIYFEPRAGSAAGQGFEKNAITPQVLKPFANSYVWLRVPADANNPFARTPQKLLSHPSFSEMHGQAGIAIIDFASRKTPLYGGVVSQFPFPSGSYYGPRHLSVILGLPKGTLTQRTLIYAVRVHPEAPASAWCQHCPQLARQAESHSNHQASINLQGHHNWDSRFQMINATLPGGMVAQEVVAESWPGQDMLSAAHECVHSWRQSEGHWSAVRSRQGLFAYDLKRGSNGVWYGTGLFGTYNR